MGPNEQAATEATTTPFVASRPLVRPGLLRLLGASCLALVGVLVVGQVVASGSPAIAAHTATLLDTRVSIPAAHRVTNVTHQRHARPARRHVARLRHHIVIVPVSVPIAAGTPTTHAAHLARADALANAAQVLRQQRIDHAAAVARAAEIAKQQQLARAAEIAKQQQLARAAEIAKQQQLAKAAEIAKQERLLQQQQQQQPSTPPARPARRDPARRNTSASTPTTPLLLSLTANVAPSPNFMASCTTPSDSIFCLGQEIEAIDNARALEGLGPMTLNISAFAAMSAPQQIFVLTNLERTARGLAPAQALTAQLNTAATTAATQDTDPSLRGWTLSGHKQAVAWNANWSGGLTATAADYYWMYSDGTGYNVNCTSATSAGCWEHRSNILSAPAETCGSPSATPQFVMGAAAVSTSSYSPSNTEIIVQVCGGLPNDVVFTWAQAEQLLSLAVG